MLDLIVPSKKKVKRMDVYLQPLIDKLKQLWEMTHVYDVSRIHNGNENVLHCMEYVHTPHMIIQD
jgi:hypothetical protein